MTACPRRPRRSSSSTAGGSRRPGPGNAVELASTPVFDALWAAPPAHAADGLRARRRPARRADGQQRGRAPEPRRRRRRAPGPDAHRRRGRRRRRSTRTRSCATRCAAPPRVHLIGLVSDGGVHSGWTHLHALIRLARDLAVPDLVIHAFTDGRDTSPTGGEGYLDEVEGWCAEAGNARIGTRHRALLRDGPRQALGPRPAGLRPARPRHAPRTTSRSRRPPRATPTSAARPTSSSARRRSATRR